MVYFFVRIRHRRKAFKAASTEEAQSDAKRNPSIGSTRNILLASDDDHLSQDQAAA